MAAHCTWLWMLAASCGAGVVAASAMPPDPSTSPEVSDSAARVFWDGADGAFRRTDGDAGSPPTTGACQPDLRVARLGSWTPAHPSLDVYEGAYQAAGLFLRLELVFDGLVNPPGPTISPGATSLYGSCPLYGFVELDIDRNVDTGGETSGPEFRYNANVARFGGRPGGSHFAGRISVDGRPGDESYDSPPWIDRSGEEFHLALLGEEVTEILELGENENGVFDPGETWLVRGYFLHRAHGFEIFTYAGFYEPLVELRFTHHLALDVTTITLVYPLTNEAHALMTAADEEDEDFDDLNANSIYEALWDLQLSAEARLLPGHEYEPLILPWALQFPEEYLNPRLWRPTFIFSTVLPVVAAGGGLHTYSDAWPDVVAGDFNGDGLATNTDARMATNFVEVHDDDPLYDADGLLNGEIALVDFGVRFSIFDVNYDGYVDDYDTSFSAQAPADYDNDGDVDLQDLAAFQGCYVDPVPDDSTAYRPACLDGFDLDLDDDVDRQDWSLLVPLLSGPGSDEGSLCDQS